MIANIKKGFCRSFFMAVQQSSAQATQANIDPDADFKLAKELYQKEAIQSCLSFI